VTGKFWSTTPIRRLGRGGVDENCYINADARSVCDS